MSNSVNINNKIDNFNLSIVMPGDKSISIRWVLLSSQAIGISKAENLLESEDVINSIKCMRALGVEIKKVKNKYITQGVGLNGFSSSKNVTLDAGNSGTLARLICGLVARHNKTMKLVGDISLSKRDFSRVIKPLKKFGVLFKSNNNKLPLIIRGNEYLRPITYNETKGSAQVKTALMLASLNTPGTTIVKSIPSRDHTELMFKNCLKIPINISKKKYHVIKVKGLNAYKGFDYKIPGDISSASFFIVLTLLAKKSKLIIKNINVNKSRIGVIEILKKMNGKVNLINKKKYKGEEIADILIRSTNNLKSINCPKHLNTKAIDEFLVIFLACAKARGVSRFKGIQELRQKESDRLKIASNFLRMIGVRIEEKFDSLKIYGNPKLELHNKYIVKKYLKDHRVFMMSCIAALTLGGNFLINDKNSIKTSFPNFISLLKKLGAKIS